MHCLFASHAGNDCIDSGCRQFDSALSGWNTSLVTDMRAMFSEAGSFNQTLESFDTSRVTDMSYMFYEAGSFNQPLDSFNTSRVTDMRYMFYVANSFNQPLDSFDVTRVGSMLSMFFGNALSYCNKAAIGQSWVTVQGSKQLTCDGSTDCSRWQLLYDRSTGSASRTPTGLLTTCGLNDAVSRWSKDGEERARVECELGQIFSWNTCVCCSLCFVSLVSRERERVGSVGLDVSVCVRARKGVNMHSGLLW